MSELLSTGDDPHVLLFPLPIQGHVPSLLHLAELLSLAGIHVTFLNTSDVHRRFLRNSPSMARLASRPRFRFRTIPDGLPDDHPRHFLQLFELEESLRTKCRDEYRQVLAGIRTDWPPVSCVVVDGMLSLACEVPEEMGIPVIAYRSSGACACLAYQSLDRLVQLGELPFQEGADLDEKIRGVATMETFLRRRDLPGLLGTPKSLSDRRIDFVARSNNNISRAKALVINTFESLEPTTLSQLRAHFPSTFAVGPLHLLLKQAVSDSETICNLWKEDESCIHWLNSQPPRSVVYASFGSVSALSTPQLLELWHGLVDSGHRFLWVIRPDILDGVSSVGTSPLELLQGTEQRGYIVEWAPQREVLSHEAVGCFFTHSGWNSTLESVGFGVPMICLPFFADQLINSRFVSEVWRIGFDMKGQCSREVVEGMVREMMEGEKGVECRRLVEEMREKATISVRDGGSSFVDLNKLVQKIKELSRDRFTVNKNVGEARRGSEAS